MVAVLCDFREKAEKCDQSKSNILLELIDNRSVENKDCGLEASAKMGTEGEMQTADYRLFTIN